MSGSSDDERIDDIATRWSLLRLAHEGPSTIAGAARSALVLKYAEAIQRYVRALVRDEHDAADLAQDVVVRLLNGNFAGATPERGRFRMLLKTAVRNTVRNHWSKEGRRRRAADIDEVAPAGGGPSPDDEWVAGWRKSLLDVTWRALDAHQRRTPGNVFHTLLRLRVDHPDDDSTALAERLSKAVGRELKPAATRQQLRRARLRFAQLLVEEIARGLDEPTPERVREELVELGVLSQVEDFLPADWDDTGELRDLR